MTSLPPRSIRPSYVAVAPSTPAHAPVKVKFLVPLSLEERGRNLDHAMQAVGL